jgi:hypothetical protein
MIYKFTSKETFFSNVLSLAETLTFRWDVETGMPEYLEWAHSDPYFLYGKGDPGQITREMTDVNYFEVNLRVTSKSQIDTDAQFPHPLKGKLTMDKGENSPPNWATFAAIWEGTGTDWLVAKGTLTHES